MRVKQSRQSKSNYGGDVFVALFLMGGGDSKRERRRKRKREREAVP